MRGDLVPAMTRPPQVVIGVVEICEEKDVNEERSCGQKRMALTNYFYPKTILEVKMVLCANQITFGVGDRR